MATHANASQNQHIALNIGETLITHSDEPQGTCQFYLTGHVSTISQNLDYNLYSNVKIRKWLDTPIAEKMKNCFIISRLDYCNKNSLLYGTKGYNISQLQLYQNNAAQMVSLRTNSIVPLRSWKANTGCLLSMG